MSNNPPTSAPPPPPTSGSNRTYAIVALLLLLGMGGLLWWKFKGGEEPHTEAPKPPPSAPTYNKVEEDIPPPPDPIPEAGPVASTPKVAVAGNACEARACNEGEVPQTLALALRQRGNQARKCYTSQLTNDPTLKVKMSINVKVGTNGSICAANLTDSSNDAVGRCVLGVVRQGGYPAAKGCVANLNVPYNYVPQQ